MELIINAKPRTVFGRKNNALRKTGTLPAVLYGRGKETVSLEVSAKEFEKVYKQAGENTLVDLAIDDKQGKKVLIHDVATHYMSDQIIQTLFLF